MGTEGREKAPGEGRVRLVVQRKLCSELLEKSSKVVVRALEDYQKLRRVEEGLSEGPRTRQEG